VKTAKNAVPAEVLKLLLDPNHVLFIAVIESRQEEVLGLHSQHVAAHVLSCLLALQLTELEPTAK
jgi:hypothetical protein